MITEDVLIAMGPFLLIFAFLVIFGLLSSREKQRRLELIHQERMAAIEKGVPLPELPEFESPNRPRLQKIYPDAALIWGIILLSVGAGGMGALALSRKPELHDYWSMPLPLALAGVGLLLYHLLAHRHTE
jgi:hypothetical protein